jgi:multidrug efflux system outer membrane protein
MKRFLDSLPIQSIPVRLVRLTVMGALLVLAGCESTGPKVETKAFPVPNAYRYGTTNADTDAARGGPSAQWWTSYGSQELDRLVDRALANNADLRIATLQLAQAKIRADQSRAGSIPSFSAPLRAVGQAQGSTADSQNNSQVTIASAYRLDAWGEQRSLVESADMQLARAVYERENVQRSVIGNLVSAYIAYLSTSDSILVARENEAVATEVLRSVEKRLALGDATLDDLEQQRAVVFSQQVLIPSLENQQEDLRQTLSRLVGALPGNMTLSEQGLDALQLPAVHTGLPSALLLGRPDIRMMEERMRAANANIEVARARLLPPIDLSAQMGYTGASLGSLLQPQNLLVTAAAALTVSIFDGGQRKGEKAFAQSYYEEMVETYGKTVLQAVRDVESALANARTASRRLEAQKGVTRAALNLFKQASDAYAMGALDDATLLEYRKRYQGSFDEAQRMKSEVLRSYATLANALGLGSSVNEAFSMFGKGVTFQTNSGMDIRVGEVDGNLSLLFEALPPVRTAGLWEAELPGVFHLSSLIPLWRDLNARRANGTQSPWLRAALIDHVNGVGLSGEAWYRVFVTGMKDQNTSIAYCDMLLGAGQSCRVVADTSGAQRKTSSARTQ